LCAPQKRLLIKFFQNYYCESREKKSKNTSSSHDNIFADEENINQICG
jgi:hypothetical protein